MIKLFNEYICSVYRYDEYTHAHTQMHAKLYFLTRKIIISLKTPELFLKTTTQTTRYLSPKASKHKLCSVVPTFEVRLRATHECDWPMQGYRYIPAEAAEGQLREYLHWVRVQTARTQPITAWLDNTLFFCWIPLESSCYCSNTRSLNVWILISRELE